MNLIVTFENKRTLFTISSAQDIPCLIKLNYGINYLNPNFEFQITTINSNNLDNTDGGTKSDLSLVIVTKSSLGDLEMFLEEGEFESVRQTGLKLIKPTQ